MNEPTTLPDQPSALIRLALSDLQRAEQDPDCEVDMAAWVSRRSDGTCVVCLAGAVMGYSLALWPRGRGTMVLPTDLPEARAKLRALDDFRRGEVLSAFGWLSLSMPAHMYATRNITPYRADPGKFYNDMYRLARDLGRAGR